MEERKNEIVANAIQNDLQEEKKLLVPNAQEALSSEVDEVDEEEEDMDDDSGGRKQGFVTQTRDSGRVQNLNQRSVRNRAR